MHAEGGIMAFNILILALSTIGMNSDNQIYNTVYECESNVAEWKKSRANALLSEDFKMSGYYQLEPIPKLLYHNLKKTGQKLDMIVTLNTDATAEKKNFTLDDKQKYENISAEEFFIERLKKGDMFIPAEHFPDIKSVKQEQLYMSIAEMVQCVREKKSEYEDVRLWVDQHGGFRENMLVLEGVIHLLAHEKIRPVAIYTVEHNPSKEKGKPSVIKVVSDHANVFEFVSGMNEFAHYGRSSALESLLKKEDSSDGTTRKELGSLMNKISDALQICDMGAFEDSLKDMGEYLEQYDRRHESLLDIFIDNIRREYGSLLNPRERTVVEEIEWCLKKDYLQQALTLIESRMPEELVDRGVMDPHYDREMRSYSYSSGLSDRIIFRDAIAKAKEYAKKAWESDINYIFIRWANNNSTKGRFDPDKRPELIKLDRERQEYRTFSVGLDEDADRRRKLKGEVAAKIKYKHEDNCIYSVSYKIALHRKICSSETNQLLFNRFLQLHRALKDQRNNANHASSSERYSAQNIRDAIGGYIDLAKEIYRICN